MKKAQQFVLPLLLVILLATVSPATAHASWWNPLSWFKKSSPIQVQQKYERTQTTETEKKDSEDKNKNTPTRENTPSTTTVYKGEKTISLKIGQKIEFKGAKASITDLLEDTRCPINARCIQAGTVKIKVKASYGILSKSVTLTQNEPYSYRGYSVTLTGVSPDRAGQTILPSDYVFTFTIAGNTQGENGGVSENSAVKNLAMCLKNKGVKFFGTVWCPHCQAQKALFGNAAQFLPYIECSQTNPQAGQTQICIDNNIDGYPTWKFPSGETAMGEQSLESLAQKSGCALNNTTQEPIDESVKTVSDLRVPGELYYDSGNSYLGFCGSSKAKEILTTLSKQMKNTPVCNDTAQAWAASIKKTSGDYQCVDSTGFVSFSVRQGLSSTQTVCAK